jgi:hypothetical protein
MINPKIDQFGNQRWYGELPQFHREDGPAIILVNGTQEWVIDGKNHRTDGPAYIRADGYQSWWINDEVFIDNKSFQEAANITDEDMTAMILKYGNVK